MSEQSRSIGVISHELGGNYFGAMINGIHQAARKAGAPLMVIQQALGEQRLPPFGADQIAGWVVLHPGEADYANLAALCASEAPVVTVPVPLEGIECALVQVDNRGGMRAAVLHLIDHGHCRIACIDHGPYSWSQQRYLGYCDALDERGIAHDPALVIRMEHPEIDGFEIHQVRGEHAARHLLEHGLPCTALAASTDSCALAAMRVLQAAGCRIPEDLAVVGFDDVVEAQYASPPLTTVRSQFDAIGRAAGERLLAEARGDRAARPEVISVPTTILHRRSCGCTTLDELLASDDASDSASASWQVRLTRQLVQVVRYPLPVDPAIPSATLWPGAGVLVAALDSALNGRQESSAPVDSAAIESAWRQAIAQTENIEALHTAMNLLEDAVEQRLASESDTATRRNVMALLRRMQLELTRARLAYEIAPKQLLGEQVRANYAVSMALVGSSLNDAQSLGWLEHTPATWGCLGLWDDQAASGGATLTIVGEYRLASWDAQSSRCYGACCWCR